MRTSSICASSFLAVSLTAVLATACSISGPTADDLNEMMPPGTGGSAAVGGSTTVTGGSVSTAGTVATTGGSGGSGIVPSGGSGGTGTTGGTGGTGTTAGTGPGGGSGGGGGTAPVGPYTPRTGSFKMLVYSKTAAFRHDGSIVTGKAMLDQISKDQGFEITLAETNELINADGLKQFEIVFFMNSTGDIFNATEQKAFEDWMTTQNGAMAGVHAATDTENGWAFYSEVTGQYYDGHGAQNVSDTIQFEPTMVDHVAVKGLPNPWQRNEEWYKFNSFQTWSVKPGFKMLGRKAADGQPITWTREWGNFRSFYTGIGHDAAVFNDPNVKKHLTGGIMWAVRREASIK